MYWNLFLALSQPLLHWTTILVTDSVHLCGDSAALDLQLVGWWSGEERSLYLADSVPL